MRKEGIKEEIKKRKWGTYQFRLGADGNILYVVVWVWMHPDRVSEEAASGDHRFQTRNGGGRGCEGVG